ncbi:MAG TPA: septum formation initiator family protein [Gemmatimonadales bacterium]|nr:septum formation initiator family protein [Gemmatimonadales bacterium]
MNRLRIAAVVMAVGGVGFGFAGGEYGTLDWWQLKRDLERERQAVERLDLEIDSLQREAEALERDPVTQERVAREQFGMLRPGEILYRVETVKP